MDRGAWWTTVHGVTKSGTRLSDLHTLCLISLSSFCTLPLIFILQITWIFSLNELSGFPRPDVPIHSICWFVTLHSSNFSPTIAPSFPPLNSLESSTSFFHLNLIEFRPANLPPPSRASHPSVFCPPGVTPFATGSLGEGVLTMDLS